MIRLRESLANIDCSSIPEQRACFDEMYTALREWDNLQELQHGFQLRQAMYASGAFGSMLLVSLSLLKIRERSFAEESTSPEIIFWAFLLVASLIVWGNAVFKVHQPDPTSYQRTKEQTHLLEVFARCTTQLNLLARNPGLELSDVMEIMRDLTQDRRSIEAETGIDLSYK